MFRFGIIPLLACSLLACPLRCVPASAIAASDAAAKPSGGCACCALPAVNSTAPTADGLTASLPEPPIDDCGCLNCICEGALVNGDADAMQMTLLDFGGGLLLTATVDARGALDNPYLLRLDRVSSHGYFLGGRAARIAHRSLLI